MEGDEEMTSNCIWHRKWVNKEELEKKIDMDIKNELENMVPYNYKEELWINVKDELPSYNQYVLATDGEFYWISMRWNDGKQDHFKSYICTCCNMECTFEATYWMQLPSLPEEKI